MTISLWVKICCSKPGPSKSCRKWKAERKTFPRRREKDSSNCHFVPCHFVPLYHCVAEFRDEYVSGCIYLTYFDNSTWDASSPTVRFLRAAYPHLPTTMCHAVTERTLPIMPAANSSAGFALREVYPGFETGITSSEVQRSGISGTNKKDWCPWIIYKKMFMWNF